MTETKGTPTIVLHSMTEIRQRKLTESIKTDEVDSVEQVAPGRQVVIRSGKAIVLQLDAVETLLALSQELYLLVMTGN